ncbi:MAG: LysR family transcriptional regulator [Gammaproteobacteria bacterium]|nr:LysR family transcriptional regulator [Gammaproteobacteria bacterium]
MNKLQSMEVFVRIAEQGSLTGAADVLGKSLPSVVRILAGLEDALQVRLFNRTTRRIALTEEGRLYLEHCRKILADVQEAEHALSQRQSEPRGMITVTAPVRFGEMHIEPAVARFLERYPKTRVNLLLLDRVVDLLEEGVDIAVRIAHLADSSLIAKPVGSVRQVVCATPELLQRFGAPTHPQALSDLPCVRFTGISPGSEWEFADGTDRLLVPIKDAFACNQVGASVNACAAGVGFGRFIDYQVMPLVGAGRLVRVLREFEPPPTPLSLVYPHTRLLSPRVRAMIDWLAEAINRTLNDGPKPAI